MFPLLETIDSPDDLRKLERKQLPKLAEELRAFLVGSVSQTGGHLSSNLGTVELTIALHYVFNTPEDKLVWDVGHQTYAHKILTGRRKVMHTLRMQNGIAGFPKREESPYDAFGTGHSSTSISAALGMAVAARLAGNDQRAVAIIGDGAMTGGMAFEALNNAGALDANMLVVLNDNDMSISTPVGALNNYLAKLMSGRFYTAMRSGSEKLLKGMPPVLEFAKRAEEHVKGMVTPGTLFEELGFNYIGPIDGHDLDTLVTTLQNIRELEGPQFLHIVTQKGKGYAHAEKDCVLYHGVGKFDPVHGIVAKPVAKKTYTHIFGDWLCDMAAADDKLVGITPAMCEGSGMVEFAEKYPQRYFDVGIAEQHALTFAAGLACDGYKPVVAIYSTFLQRAYDQLIHDIAIQNLPVMLAIDRGGLVGADGATHAGAFDLSFLRCIPNMTVMAPADENECRSMLTTAYRMNTPTAVRYPRGSGTGAFVHKDLQVLPVGKGELRRQGGQIAILAFGSMLAPALEAAESLDATVTNMRFIKPLDEELVLSLARAHRLLVTVEENTIQGGAGSAVAECLARHGITIPILHLGLPDTFIEQGEHAKLLADCGLDAAGIAHSIRKKLPD
ncbi:MAG: 1-deoxy-D-xylulose-5-phosphate [Gallionellaceae bacterium]|nr:MAG: 1-deoxy-D-xylulose-5-phosphate [Gallionellaceae bacterium]